MPDLEKRTEGKKEASLSSLVRNSFAKAAAIAAMSALPLFYGCGNDGGKKGKCEPCASDSDCSSSCCSPTTPGGVCAGPKWQNPDTNLYDYDYCYPSKGCGYK